MMETEAFRVVVDCLDWEMVVEGKATQASQASQASQAFQAMEVED